MSMDSRKRTLLFIVMATSAFVPFMASAVNIALPSLSRDLHLDAVSMSWIATAYLLASTAFILPFGRLADIHGRRTLFIIGLSLFMIASVLAGAAPNFCWLLTARIAQGLGTSMMLPTGMAMLTAAFPPGERGRALGLNVSAVYVGLAVGPVLGGLLTQALGWRSLFFLMGPLSLLTLMLLLKNLRREPAETPGEPFDAPGSLLFAFSISALLYGFTSLPGARAIGVIALGLAAMLAFIWRQSRTAHPIVDLSLFRSNRTFAMSNVATFLNYGATTAVVFLLSLYLQYVKGLSPRDAGMLMMVQPLVQALTSPIAGRLSDRIEPQRLASAGMMMTVLGLLLLSALNAATSTGFILACLTLLGLGFGIFSSPNTNAIMSSVAKRNYSIASATVSAMRQLGQIFSMGLATLALTGIVGHRVITPELHGPFITTIRLVLQTSAALCFIGVFASLARGKLRPSAESAK